MSTTDKVNLKYGIADWQREAPRYFWDPGRKLLLCIRQYQKWRGRGCLGLIICKVCVLRHRFWSVVTGADIPINAKIGGGLLIPHPNGIVIHPDAEIGINCLIHQQVTIGTTRSGGLPTIRFHVDIGAGAKILGAVTLHEHSLIGANAVVTKDVQAFQIVAGIPAKLIRTIEPEELL